jgi:hypothetical protein
MKRRKIMKNKAKKILASACLVLIGMGGLTGCGDEDNINIQVKDGYIQWQVDGSEGWNNLLTIDKVKNLLGESYKGDAGAQGLPGINGKEIELRCNETHIQWRYVGDEQWSNLIALEDLRVKEETVDVEEMKQRAFDLFQSKLFNMDTLSYKITYDYEDNTQVVESFGYFNKMSNGSNLSIFTAIEYSGGKYSPVDEEEKYDNYTFSAIAERNANIYIPDRVLTYTATYNLETQEYYKICGGGTELYTETSASNNVFDFNYLKELKTFTKESIIDCQFNEDGDCKILFKYCGDGGSRAHHTYLNDKYLFEFNITKDGWIVRCNVYEKDFLNDEIKGDLFCKISYESGMSLISEDFLNNIFDIEKEKHPEIQYWEDVFTNETFA